MKRVYSESGIRASVCRNRNDNRCDLCHSFSFVRFINRPVTTIETFSKPEEAHLLRMRLEEAGIPAFVQDEYIVQMDWLYSNAIGGVRVQIADEDVAAAREFLVADRERASQVSVGVTCPACGSDETTPDKFPGRINFLGFLIDLPFACFKNRLRCQSCDCVFRPDPPPR